MYFLTRLVLQDTIKQLCSWKSNIDYNRFALIKR
jgi:hypothetical protein